MKPNRTNKKGSVQIIAMTVFVAALLVAGGLMQGLYSARWSQTEERVAVAGRLAGLPKQIGPWRMLSDKKLDEQVERMLESDTYLSRIYQHEGTDQTVSLFVLLGRPGPVAAHTPEICYPSQHYTITADAKEVPIGDDRDQVWVLNLRTNDVHQEKVRSYYGWRTAGPWRASKNARLDFAGQPFLVKVQVETFVGSDGEKDSATAFLSDFLPTAKRVLDNPAL